MTTHEPSTHAIPSNSESESVDAIPLHVLPRAYVRNDEA